MQQRSAWAATVADSDGRPCCCEQVVADDVAAKAERLMSVTLELVVTNVMAADEVTIALNGHSLSSELLRRNW